MKLVKILSALCVTVGLAFAGRAEWNEDYIPVDYIHLNGDSYVNTGYVPEADDIIEVRVRLDACTSATAGTIWCSRAGSKDRSFSAIVSGGCVRYDRGDSEASKYANYAFCQLDAIATHELRGNGETLYVNGIGSLTAAPSAAFAPVGPLVLGASYNLADDVPGGFGTHLAGRLYRARVINAQGVTVHDYVPCRTMDDTPTGGLYDLVAGAFVAPAAAVSVGPDAALVSDETDFGYKCSITFPGKSDIELQDFPVPVRISSKTITGFSYSQVKADASDLRFADEAGFVLPHEVELWDATSDESESLVWVSVPNLRKTSVLTMYWGGKDDAAGSRAATEVWTRAGYVGVWHMGDATVDHLEDSTGHGLHGCAPDGYPNRASATSEGAYCGKATKFTGYLRFPVYTGVVTPAVGASFQWSAWVRSDKSFSVANYPFYTKSVWNASDGWYVCWQNGSRNIGFNGAGASTQFIGIGHDVSCAALSYLGVAAQTGNNAYLKTEDAGSWVSATSAKELTAEKMSIAFGFDGGVTYYVYDEMRLRDCGDLVGSGSAYFDLYNGRQVKWMTEEIDSVKKANYCSYSSALPIGLGSLVIESSEPGVGTVDPAYTSAFALEHAGDEKICTAEEFFAVDQKLYVCTGYEIRVKTEDGWSAPETFTGRSYTYVQGVETRKLTWCWEIVGYPLALAGDCGGAAFGTVETAGGQPAQPIATIDGLPYYAAGETYRIVPTTNNGTVDCAFQRWLSGAAPGHESDNPLVLELNGPVSLYGAYVRLGWVLADEGQTLTDGWWKFAVEETEGGLRLKSAQTGGQALDLSSCEATAGKKVVAVGASVFSGSAALTSFVGPDVVEIGESAFANAAQLTNVVLSTGVSTLGRACFSGCQTLKTVWPQTFANVTSIPESAFYHCYKLSGNLSFPEVTAVRASAFEGDNGADRSKMVKGLSLSFPKATSVGSRAFYYCYMATNLVFSDALAVVDGQAFAYLETLERFEPLLPKGLTTVGVDSTVHSARTFIYGTMRGVCRIDAPQLTVLPKEMLAICRQLDEIVISSPIATVGDYALGCLKGGARVTFNGDRPATLGTKWISAAEVTKSPWDATAGEAVKPYAQLRVNLKRYPAWGSLVTYGRGSPEFKAARKEENSGYPGAATAGLAVIDGFKVWLVDVTPGLCLILK